MHDASGQVLRGRTTQGWAGVLFNMCDPECNWFFIPEIESIADQLDRERIDCFRGHAVRVEVILNDDGSINNDRGVGPVCGVATLLLPHDLRHLLFLLPIIQRAIGERVEEQLRKA